MREWIGDGNETQAADGIGQSWRCGNGSEVEKERELAMRKWIGRGKGNASCRWNWSVLAMSRKRCQFGGKVTGSVMDQENE